MDKAAQRKAVGSLGIVLVLSLALVEAISSLVNLHDFFTIVTAELVVGIPLILVWMFKPELDRHFGRDEEKVLEQVSKAVKEPRLVVLEGEIRTFDFVIESTTDWFAVGIEGSQLQAVLGTTITNGRIRKGAPDLFKDQFNMKQLSPTLRARVVAQFKFEPLQLSSELPEPKSVIGISQKTNLGSLKIEVFDHASNSLLGRIQYQRTEGPKNLMRFAISFEKST
jgi:hypothetical protein